VIVYGNDKYTGPIIPYYKINANKGWLRHYGNFLYLKFMASRGNFNEKKQANDELVICERKLAWHEKHCNFDWAVIIPEKTKLTNQWKV